MAAKYGTPYFNNMINSDLNPQDVRSMCCRLNLDLRELRKSGGVFSSHDNTGSIGVVTINLPRIARNNPKVEDYLKEVVRLTELSIESLEIKRVKVTEMFEAGMFPYAAQWLPRGWKTYFSTVGICGGAEAYWELDADLYGWTYEDFSIKTLQTIRDVLQAAQERTGNLYNLEETPAEGVSDRFARIDGYGYDYYTQGMKLPFDESSDIIDILQRQEEVFRMYTGGSVQHIFLGEAITPEQAKLLIRRVCEKFKTPYYTLSPTFSVCSEHGHKRGKVENCPQCGKACEVYSRVVGYYAPVNRWNKGKLAEWGERKTYEEVVRKF
jgi:ribonucleoside-triphosphate reductase